MGCWPRRPRRQGTQTGFRRRRTGTLKAARRGRNQVRLSRSRQDFAARWEGKVDSKAMQPRLSVAQDQGAQPSRAVAKGTGRTPKARKTRGANVQAKVLQRGMSR